MDAQLFAFIGIAALLTITPGADMALITKISLSSGRRSAFLATLGICLGVIFWGAASGLGIAALLSTSATAFTILKWVGAAYLIYLGVSTILRTRKNQSTNNAEGTASTLVYLSPVAAFRQGLLSNLLNPKIGVFYSTFLPQFISPGDSVLAKSIFLAGIHAAMGIVWLAGYSYCVARVGDFLRRPTIKRWLDRVTGLVLIGFGLRLALEER